MVAPLPRPAAILYDFDYTLADSSSGIIECAQFAFVRMGLPAPQPAAVCQTIGLSLPATFRALAPASSSALISDFISLFVARADEIMVESTVLLPHAAATLAALRQGGLRQAIVTTKYRRRIERVLEREACRDCIETIVGGDDVVEPKPSPEGIFKALSRLGCSAAEAVYVGDSAVDAAAARAAGVRFIAVLTGKTSPAELRRWQPEFLLESLRELPGIMLAPGLSAAASR